MLRPLVSAFVIFLVTGLAARAEEFSVGDLTIRNPVIFKSFTAARAAGGYMTIGNAGVQPDRLTGVAVDGPMAMIHESREDEGVTRMIHLDAVEIPAGDTVAFRPGGLHIMIMGLQPDDLPVGDTLDAVLRFDRAGEVNVRFLVIDQPAN